VIGLKSGRHTNVRKKGNGKNVKREIEKEIEEIEEEELFINATKSCSWLVSLFGDILIRLFNPEEKRRKKK
jgi:ribosomal silencing factor RsfS